MELKQDRNWLVVMLLNIVTIGIYGIYLTHVQIRDTNIACERDGKRTSGLFKLIFLSLITLGIYSIVWDIKIVLRWQRYAEVNSYKPRYSIVLHVILNYVLSLTGICALIGFILKLAAFNQMCEIYNENNIGHGGYSKKDTFNPADNLWGWRDSPSGRL